MTDENAAINVFNQEEQEQFTSVGEVKNSGSDDAQPQKRPVFFVGPPPDLSEEEAYKLDMQIYEEQMDRIRSVHQKWNTTACVSTVDGECFCEQDNPIIAYFGKEVAIVKTQDCQEEQLHQSDAPFQQFQLERYCKIHGQFCTSFDSITPIDDCYYGQESSKGNEKVIVQTGNDNDIESQ
ncbi:hypothetical protein QR680_000829 [Steinernema hermaphroditum]|uniref:Uncharacterized protein n=1 Tax=Steinernema hermaphroditum TaxID=289476 RepID=A0AA39GYT7_9BILA|nr:hypothetical protein QR680_000829 [Steinernema hermaphroditum]